MERKKIPSPNVISEIVSARAQLDNLFASDYLEKASKDPALFKESLTLMKQRLDNTLLLLRGN